MQSIDYLAAKAYWKILSRALITRPEWEPMQCYARTILFTLPKSTVLGIAKYCAFADVLGEAEQNPENITHDEICHFSPVDKLIFEACMEIYSSS